MSRCRSETVTMFHVVLATPMKSIQNAMIATEGKNT